MTENDKNENRLASGCFGLIMIGKRRKKIISAS